MAQRLLPSEPCLTSSCDVPRAVLQNVILGFDSAPSSCHAPEPSHFCMRIPTRDPSLHCRIYCKISGRTHVLLGGWDILCTNLTEWLLQKTQVVVREECCGHGCRITVAYGVMQDTLTSHPDLHVMQTNTIPRPKPTSIQRSCTVQNEINM